MASARGATTEFAFAKGCVKTLKEDTIQWLLTTDDSGIVVVENGITPRYVASFP